MLTKLAELVARRPRYQVIDEVALRIFVDEEPGQAPTEIRGSLMDISRTGAKFRIWEFLTKGDSITLQIEHKSGLQIRVPAEVCWCNSLADGRTDVGCHLKNEIGWEAMGELFLNSIISTEEEP